MSAEGIKPMASLGSALLGRRPAARRVPLTFAPIAELAADAALEADLSEVVLPEVVLQVARLAEALGVEAPLDPVDAHEPANGAARPRVAFTLRLDPVRHGRLRQLAAAQARSAQAVLIEALDRYDAGLSGLATRSATQSSPSPASTGNQP